MFNFFRDNEFFNVILGIMFSKSHLITILTKKIRDLWLIERIRYQEIGRSHFTVLHSIDEILS
jgi:hypothetical protein